MKINNAVNQISRIDVCSGDNFNALKTAEKSLKAWSELKKEVFARAIIDRADVLELINYHIERMEA